MVKSQPANAGDVKRSDFDPWVGKIPWRRKWQATPVFLPGESHGWMSLVHCGSWGCKELDTTEHACMHIHYYAANLGIWHCLRRVTISQVKVQVKRMTVGC